MSAAAEGAFQAGISVHSRDIPGPPNLPGRSAYRPDIDGLRALAIIPVVLFHAFPAIMPGGFVGVDIFFVISGFLISTILLQSLQHGTFSFGGFYANRIRRIFPALLLVLAACFVFGWFFLLPDEYAQLGKHIVGAAGYIENFLLRREAGYFDVRSYQKPLMHIWSLGIEEQFYLTYPLFLWLMWRVRRNLPAILVSVALVSFALNVWQVRNDVVGAFFLPQTRCWELMVGGAIACWELGRKKELAGVGEPRPRSTVPRLPNINEARIRNIFSALGLLLIGVAVVSIQKRFAFPGWWALLPVGGAALLILGGPKAWINRNILATKSLVFVGLISYSLYLWHWPVLTFPRIVHGSELSVFARCAGVLLSFALAAATWRYVENPVRFGRKTWVKTALLMSASVVMGVAGYVAHRDGFIGRFPGAVADLGRLQDVQWSAPECRKSVGIAEIDYCLSTGAGAPAVLLIGDSHASTLYRGLAAEFEKRSQVLTNLGQAGCAPFYDTESFQPGRPHNNCKPVNQMLDFSVANASARTIILSLRGPLNMSGRGFGASEEEGVLKEIVWKNGPKNAGPPEMFAAALRNTVSRLYASGKQLILFIDWPELGFDPRSCLSRPVSFFSNPPRFCGVPRAEVDARNLAYRKLMFDLKNEFPRLKVFDPLPYFCDSSACYAMESGHLFYSDDNHLSDVGAVYLGKKFIDWFQP